MSQKDNKKQRTVLVVEGHQTKIDAVTKTLARLLRKPLLALLDGAEPGEDEIELDRWWTLDGISHLSADKLQNISECFSRLAQLHHTRCSK